MPKKKDQFPILYHEARTGKLHSWKVWTEGNVLCCEYGTVDGEKSSSRKEIPGKNIGKKNETTPEEQAIKEAKALHKKKLDGKYRLTKSKARETVFLPMLAQDFRKMKKPLKFPVDVQPKLDGLRCTSYWEDGVIKLMSRNAKIDYIPTHIKEEVASLLPEGSVLDGELYVHGMALQDINAISKKYREPDHPDYPGGTEQLEFVVFDGFHVECTDHPWSRRREDLEKLIDSWGGPDTVKVSLVKTETVHSQEELEAALKKFEEMGFEGVIIRMHDGPYRLGHRSRDLLKYKNFMDDEFEIVSHKEARGNDKGTVVWICQTKEDKQFEVRPKGTRKKRAEWFKQAESFYGKMLTVRFQQYTKDGIPQFPVGINVRDDK